MNHFTIILKFMVISKKIINFTTNRRHVITSQKNKYKNHIYRTIGTYKMKFKKIQNPKIQKTKDLDIIDAKWIVSTLICF